MRTVAGSDVAQPTSTRNDLTDRVLIKVADASDVLTDLTEFAVSLEYDQGTDELADAATIVFRRLEGVNSLAPLMTASPPIDIGRRVTVAVNPGGGTFREVFRGRIDVVDWPERFGDVTVNCRDQAGVAADTWIETARELDTVDGADLEVVMQSVADLNLAAPPTLYFPAPTSAVVQHDPGDPAYAPVDEAVLDAMRTLAESIGWTIRWRNYDASPSDWKWTVFEPSRGKTVADHTFGTGDYWDVTTMRQDIADIRNVIEVEYVGAGQTVESVQYPAELDVATDPSVVRYGRRYMKIAEPTGSPVNNETLALAMAMAAYDDLSEPDALVEITGRYFWPGEIGVDLYTFTANNIHFSDDQTLAAMRFSHRIAVGERPTTKILCRGKPSGGVLMWRRKLSRSDDTVPQTADIIRVSSTESSDGSERDFTITVGPRVDTVHLWYRTVPVAVVGDPLDFSGNEIVTEVPTHTILTRTPGSDLITFSIPHPSHGYRVAGRMIPYKTPDPDPVEGASWPFMVDPAPPVYTGCRAKVTAVSSTQVTVTVTADALEGTPTVGLVGVTGSAALASGHAAGTYTYAQNGTDNVWVFNRGAIGAGPGQVQFRSVLSGSESDDDFVEIPEIGRDTVYLASRARVTASTATTATVRYAVADPYPQGASSVTVTYTETGGTGTACSPASPQSITPAATLTEAAGTYVDFTVTRPAFGTGSRRVTFTATAANRVSDSDAVDIPAVERDTVALVMRARVTASTSTTQTIRVAVADPYPQGAASATITYSEVGGTGTACSPASGGTVTPAATITEGAGTYIDYTVTRPNFQTGSRRVTFTATAADRTSAFDAIDVPAVETDFTMPTLDLSPTVSAGSVSIAFTSTGTVEFKIDDGAYGAASSPEVITRTAEAQVVTFKAVLGTQTVYGSITVPAALGTTSTGFFTSVSQAILSHAADTVTLSWSWVGDPAYFRVFVKDGAVAWDYVGDTIVGASSYVFTSSYDLTLNVTPTVDIEFYVRAVTPEEFVMAESPHSVATYGN